MLKILTPSLLLGFVFLHGTNLLAAESDFAFHNSTKETVHIGVGTVDDPPKEADIQIKPGARETGKVDRSAAPEIIVKIGDEDEVSYQIDAKAVKSGKNVKLNLVKNPLSGNISLQAKKLERNNITDSDITIKEPEKKSGDDTTITTPDEETKTPDEETKTPDEETKTPDEETKTPSEDETPPKKKPTLDVTPEIVLGLGSSRGDLREAKILGLKDIAAIKKATSEPAGFLVPEIVWNGIKKAQAAITSAYNEQRGIWDSKKRVSSSAKAILKKHGVDDPDEQKELAEEIHKLIKRTYTALEKRFVKEEE